MGFSFICQYDNLTTGRLAEYLNVAKSTVQYWIANHSLKASFRNPPFNTILAIKLSDFKKWVQKNPEKVCHVDRDTLLWLLSDDEELVNFIKSSNQKWKPTALIRIDKNTHTEKKYPSVLEASKDIFIDRSNLCRQVRKARSQNKNQFEYHNYLWKISS